MITQLFQGRLSRGYYWKAVLLFAGLTIAVVVATSVAFGGIAVAFLLSSGVENSLVVAIIGFILLGILYVVGLLVGIGLSVRRLHDLNLPGWLVLIGWALGVITTVFGRLSSDSPEHIAYAPWAWALIAISSIIGLAIALWPGKSEANNYGEPTTYSSWWAALIGRKP